MRWVLRVLAVGFPIAAVQAQTCPVPNFLQGAAVTLVDQTHAAGLQRQADGSYTRLRYQNRTPYGLIDSTPDFQSALPLIHI